MYSMTYCIDIKKIIIFIAKGILKSTNKLYNRENDATDFVL